MAVETTRELHFQLYRYNYIPQSIGSEPVLLQARSIQVNKHATLLSQNWFLVGVSADNISYSLTLRFS